MTHRNLPALNKYTSQTQYEALKVIDETKSIIQIVQNGQSSKTLGALVRSMWIKQTDYTDDKGVLREGWFVTDDGRHAMTIFAEKLRLQEVEQTKQEGRKQKYFDLLVDEHDLIITNKARLQELDLEMAKLNAEIKDVTNKRQVCGWMLNPPERDFMWQLADKYVKERTINGRYKHD